MESTKLKDRIIDKVFDEPELFGKVSKILHVKPISLPRLLRSNHHKLRQLEVLNVIAEFLKIEQVSDLLESKSKNVKKS